jgi:hypothetical protein
MITAKSFIVCFCFIFALHAEKFLFPKKPEQFVHGKKVIIGKKDLYLNIQNGERVTGIAGEYYQVGYETKIPLVYLKSQAEDKYFYVLFADLSCSGYTNALGFFGSEENPPKNISLDVCGAAAKVRGHRFIYHPAFGTRYYQQIKHCCPEHNIDLLSFRSAGLFHNYFIQEEINQNNKIIQLKDPRTELSWIRVGIAAFSFLAPAAFYYLKYRNKK